MISLGFIRRRLRKLLDKLIGIVSRIARMGGMGFCLDWPYSLFSILVGRRTGKTAVSWNTGNLEELTTGVLTAMCYK